MVFKPNRAPDVITTFKDRTNNIDIHYDVWFNGNEILICHGRYNLCTVFSQKDGIWMYRLEWKEAPIPLSYTNEFLEILNDLAMQRDIEKSIKKCQLK